MKKYDVVIIGGGPSGSSLGVCLLKQGVSTLIIDKRSFPRKKLCAGGVTPDAQKLYEEIFGAENFTYADSSNVMKLYFRSEFIMDVNLNHPLKFVDRETFDHQLFKRYLSLGGTAMTGVKPISFDVQNSSITLNDGEVVEYNVLVGADGAFSTVRKLVDDKYKPNAFCVETFVKNVNNDHQVYMYLGEGGGYGWVFPHNDTVAIGYGGSNLRASYNTEHFENFVQTCGYTLDGYEKKGAYIPTIPIEHPCKGKIMLIGDAGGFVFPTTGEGLYYSAYTALRASETIYKFLSGKITEDQIENDFKQNLTEIYSVTDKALNATGRLNKGKLKRKFVGFCQNSKFLRKVFCKYCKKRPELVSYAFEELSAGRCFNPFKIRRDFYKKKKSEK